MQHTCSNPSVKIVIHDSAVCEYRCTPPPSLPCPSCGADIECEACRVEVAEERAAHKTARIVTVVVGAVAIAASLINGLCLRFC